MAYDFSVESFSRRVAASKEKSKSEEKAEPNIEAKAEAEAEASAALSESPDSSDDALISEESTEASSDVPESESESESDIDRPVSDMAVSADEDAIEREPVIREQILKKYPDIPPADKAKAPGRKTLKPTQTVGKEASLKSVRVNRAAVMLARSLMPDVTTDSDAVDACLACLFGDVDVSEQAKLGAAQLDRSLSRSDPAAMAADVQRLIKRSIALERRNERLLRELQLAIVFLLGDRLNYNVGMSSTPSQVDFLWPQYDLLYRRLLAQTEQFKKEQDDISGRELYENKSNGKEIKP